MKSWQAGRQGEGEKNEIICGRVGKGLFCWGFFEWFFFGGGLRVGIKCSTRSTKKYVGPQL